MLFYGTCLPRTLAPSRLPLPEQRTLPRALAAGLKAISIQYPFALARDVLGEEISTTEKRATSQPQ